MISLSIVIALPTLLFLVLKDNSYKVSLTFCIKEQKIQQGITIVIVGKAMKTDDKKEHRDQEQQLYSTIIISHFWGTNIIFVDCKL